MTATANTTATDTAERVECRKCGRELRSAASVAAGIGPRCAAIEAATEGLSAKQVDKMKQVILDGGVAPTSRPKVYRVTSEDGSSVHIAHVNGNCTCQWGLRRVKGSAKTCYGVAAARLIAKPVIRARQQAAAPVLALAPAPADIWAEIERLNDAFMAAV